MKGTRLHAKEYITSLDEQSDQYINHFQGSQAAIEPYIDVNNEENGEESDFDPRNGYCFVDFAQLSKPSPQINSFIRENANDMNEINEGVMASPEMLIARGRQLGDLRARVVGSSSNIQIHNIDGLPLVPIHLGLQRLTLVHYAGMFLVLTQFTTRVHTTLVGNNAIFMTVLMRAL